MRHKNYKACKFRLSFSVWCTITHGLHLCRSSSQPPPTSARLLPQNLLLHCRSLASTRTLSTSIRPHSARTTMEVPSANICNDNHEGDPYCSLYREQGLPPFRGLHLHICNDVPNLLLVRKGRNWVRIGELNLLAWWPFSRGNCEFENCSEGLTLE